MISVSTDGVPGNGDSYFPAILLNGRYVAFWSLATNLVKHDANGVGDVFVRDRRTGRTRRVSVTMDGAQANGLSCCTSLSADGRLVAFASVASNLVPDDTNGGVGDVFVRIQDGE